MEQITNTDSRRRFPRRVVSLRVGLLARGIYSAEATALEIGEGGMLLQSFLKIEKNQKVVVTIRVRGVLQGVLLASVIYVSEATKPNELTRFGLHFDDIEFEVKRKIRNFVASGNQYSVGSFEVEQL